MNICVIGGDSRILELIKFLEKEGNKLSLYGLEQSEELKAYNHFDNMEYALENCELVITSIPLSKNGKTVNSIYTTKEILIGDLFNKVKNKKIITGNLTEEIKNFVKIENNNEIIDVLKYEDLTVLNSIPTAEGAIQIAMEKSKITLHGSKCLILGFGRIGKILAKMLIGIGANVYCEARKHSDIAWIKAYGYNAINLTELDKYLNDFDFIFNTIPHLILDKDKLSLVSKECILIDLASKPGGIDFNEAKRRELQTEWALALPGKVAPKSSANYIYQIIKQVIADK